MSKSLFSSSDPKLQEKIADALLNQKILNVEKRG